MPNGPAGIQGLRGTGQFSTDFRPTNYREYYTLLEPNGSAPLNALLSMAQSEATDDPKFNQFQDELPDRTLVIDHGAGYTTETTLQLTSGSQVGYVVTGTVIVNPRTGEVMRATANGDTGAYTIVVTRNIGGTAYTITDVDDLIIAGHAAVEGGDTPGALSFDPTMTYNYTQIFKTAFQLTGSTANTHFRTGSKETEYTNKALKLHMTDIERTMFWGKRSEVNGSTAQPLRYTGGILTTLSQILDGDTQTTAGTITEEAFDDYLIGTVFAFGSKEKIAIGGATVAGHLQKFGKNRWSPSVVDNTYGVNITRYATMAGSLNFMLHPQFRQMPQMANMLVILDLPYLRYRHMANRDTQLLKDRQGNGTDGKIHEFLTDCGLEFLQNKVHTVIKNWDAIA